MVWSLATTPATTRSSKKAKPEPSSSSSSSGTRSSTERTPSSASLPSANLSPLVTASPLAFSSTPCQNQVLELELMHRWSTRTWKMLYAIPECTLNVQTHLTRASLGCTFMTKGILAVAALDTYMHGGGMEQNRQTYIRAALEYMNDASVNYRRQLADMRRDNLWLLSDFSGLLGMFHFAVPSSYPGGRADAETQTVLHRTILLFAMIIASFDISAVNWNWSLDSPTSARTILDNYPTDLSLMDHLPADVLTATKRMTRVADVIHLPPTGDPAIDVGPDQGPIASSVLSYRTAIGQTRYAYAENRIRGYCISVASAAHAAGPEFFAGLRAREPVALFIIMYWGVLMQAEDYDDLSWWFQGCGRALVAEVSELLAVSALAALEDAREGITWARRQVGLDSLRLWEEMPEEPVVLDVGGLEGLPTEQLMSGKGVATTWDWAVEDTST